MHQIVKKPMPTSKMESKHLKVQLSRIQSSNPEVDSGRRPTRHLTMPVNFEEEAQMMIDFVNGNDAKLPLTVAEIPGKGRGIISTEIIPKDTFVVEYVGEMITGKKAKEMERVYSSKDVGSFMYFFRNGDKLFCIDATLDSPRLGRLINHSIELANIKPKLIFHKKLPHIVFFSTRIIQKGEELLYPYGDQRKESVKNFPFLKH